MTFANPGMLGILGLVPLLIIIHTLKPRARRAEVTQLFLWEEVLRERGRQIRFERLKKNLLLLFQIATVICLAGALADPVTTGFTQPLGRMILVIDTSASMQARVPAGTRFDLARLEALTLIERLGPDQQAIVIEAGSEPVLHAGFQDDPRAVRRLIESLSASDAPAKLGKALHLALSFVDPAGADYVYLITDGAGAAGTDHLPAHPRIVPRVVADGGSNVGITRFEFAQIPGDAGTYELMLEIGNFSAEPVDCPVRLSIDSTPVRERSVRLEARERKVLIFTYTGLVAGVAKAVLGVDDDLGVDNAAYLAFNTAAELWVLLVSRGNIFLEKILGAYPHVRVNATREIVASSWHEQTLRHDIVVVDRTDFPPVERGNFLLIDALSPHLPLVRDGRVDNPAVLDWDRGSPLLENVDLSGLAIAQAARLRAVKPMEPVIEAAETGLMYAFASGGLRAVLLGFDITRSDLPLRVAFPVMISNCINWLNPHRLHFSTSQARAGEPFAIHLSPGTRSLAVRPPDGSWETYTPRTNPYPYAGTARVGIYRVVENEKGRDFTVNLVNAAESDLQGTAGGIPAGQPTPPPGSDPIPVRRHRWIYCLLAGIVCLALEWHFWLKTA